MRRLWAACCMGVTIGTLFAGTASASQFRWLHWTPRQVLPRVTITGSAWAQAQANRSRMPEPRVTIRMAWSGFNGCSVWTAEAEACTDSRTIWERPHLGPRRIVFDFYHELGHTFDWYDMTDSARARFIRITHDHAGWNQPDAISLGGLNDPAERFADAYAVCSLYGPRLPDSAIVYANGIHQEWDDSGGLSGSGYDPTPSEHARVCRLILTRN